MTALPPSISPCSNVRRTCYILLKNKSFEDGGNRGVAIASKPLDELGTSIANSITQQKKEHTETSFLSTESCINNLTFASWDEENWHYTASNYKRVGFTIEEINQQRFERVALYVMVMDTINFCFWPCTDSEDESDSGMKNLLEYEHLASALKMLAEKDDTINGEQNMGTLPTRAEDSYLLAPQNLVKLNTESFLELMTPLLPPTPQESKEKYIISNASERVRLLNEMAQALLTFHHGSATHFISQSHKSSDLLVHNILQYFPGFRDTANDPTGRWVAFYKRAQILVSDLWAALGSEQGEEKHGLDICNFTDMGMITTFPDYRIPQLLRSMGVLKYAPSLAAKVDKNVELRASSMDELYIRAATVVAVDMLVENVRGKVRLKEEINSVKMDWYLWNIGEKLDRQGKLSPHHRVRTIFY